MSCLVEGDGNLWWSGAIDLGVKKALDLGCEKVLFLNDDLVLDKKFFSVLQEVSESKMNVMVSSVKLHRKKDGGTDVLTGGFRMAGMLRQLHNLGAGGTYEDYRKKYGDVVECDALTGAALLIPAQIFTVLGGLDLKDYPHNWGDLEFTRRARMRGFRCLVATDSCVYTEPNPNYHMDYLKISSGKDYLQNLFDNRKYNYGFSMQWKMAILYKPLPLGILLFAVKMVGLMRWFVLKIIMPPSLLKRYVTSRTNP